MDAAKFTASHPLNLTEAQPDFLTLSFYKVFGYPTGVGALIIRSSTALELKKHYWGGGTVSIAGAGRTASDDVKVFKGRIAEKFEEPNNWADQTFCHTGVILFFVFCFLFSSLFFFFFFFLLLLLLLLLVVVVVVVVVVAVAAMLVVKHNQVILSWWEFLWKHNCHTTATATCLVLVKSYWDRFFHCSCLCHLAENRLRSSHVEVPKSIKIGHQKHHAASGASKKCIRSCFPPKDTNVGDLIAVILIKAQTCNSSMCRFNAKSQICAAQAVLGPSRAIFFGMGVWRVIISTVHGFSNSMDPHVFSPVGTVHILNCVLFFNHLFSRSEQMPKKSASMVEDGTVAFLGIAALKHGFDALQRVGGMAPIERHTSCLASELHQMLLALRHTNGEPVTGHQHLIAFWWCIFFVWKKGCKQ